MSLRGRQAPSKASATTRCQKCLQNDKSRYNLNFKSADNILRHYSYECRESLQARPYKTRPSRTQQLHNPKLTPKLSSDVPNDLLRKKGVADEQLAKLEKERQGTDGPVSSTQFGDDSRKRPRSPSSDSSVSTISTNLSRSVSPDYTKTQTQDPDRMLFSQQQSQPLKSLHFSRKRRHSYSSSSSGNSYTRKPSRKDGSPRDDDEDRNTRRRRSSMSPGERGRSAMHGDDRKRRGRSRDNSMDRSQIAKYRQSLTPDHRNHISNGADNTFRRPGADLRGNGYDWHRDGTARGAGKERSHLSGDEPRGSRSTARQPSARERSLSPYSKRLALTQAMGR